MKFVFSKSIMLNDKDWSASSIHEIIEDILETKKATLGSKGFYSHVSGEISPFLTRLVPVPEFLLSAHRVVRKSPSKIDIIFYLLDPMVRRRLNPIPTLFIWALMTQKFKLAEILWLESQNDGLTLALVGSAFCRAISKLNISAVEYEV